MSEQWDPDTQPKRPEMTLGELFGEMTSDVSTLFRKEIELAKAEAKEQGAEFGKSAAMFGVAGLGGWMALLFVSFALAWLLDEVMHLALAFALVGVLWAVVAYALLGKAKRQLKENKKVMPVTTQTIKEDMQWAKTLSN